jgi:hypothetical protein
MFVRFYRVSSLIAYGDRNRHSSEISSPKVAVSVTDLGILGSHGKQVYLALQERSTQCL